MTITPQEMDALILIDVQNDFMPGGALAVPDGDAIIPKIEDLAGRFDRIVLTQDWHPAGHESFASTHGKQPFETIDMAYGPQILWPDHCVQGSPGAEFALPGWILNKAQMIIRKGFRRTVDSYSAFFENDQVTPTGLAGYLREQGVTRVVMAGLATDFCVGFSALDARRKTPARALCGFETVVITEACRGIAPDSVAAKMDEMAEAGVIFA